MELFVRLCSLIKVLFSDNRWRAPATASYTGVVCGAVAALVRQLHAAPQWQPPLAALLLQQLQLATQMVSAADMSCTGSNN